MFAQRNGHERNLRRDESKLHPIAANSRSGKIYIGADLVSGNPIVDAEREGSSPAAAGGEARRRVVGHL